MVLPLYDPGVIRTRFTELFDLQHPVMSAPMAMHSGGTLAASVSAAGGLGSFGGQFAGGPDWVREQVALVRGRTEGPFAIGFITAFLEHALPDFEAALEARPDAIVLSFGDPSAAARRVKDAGVRLICQVQTLEDAERSLDAGADVLIAQGNEAGGHTGTMGLLPLVTAIAERHPDVPLLAAGGIGFGRAVAAVLMAGADGVMLGTAFLVTPEAIEVAESNKQAIVESHGGDTVFTRTYDIASRMPWPETIGFRVRRDSFTDAWDGREEELRASLDSVTAGPPVIYGQGAGGVSAVRPAGVVIESMCAEAEALLRERSGRLLA